MNKKRKILVMIDWFDPAYKAGGPIRSCVNFISQLQDSCEIYVLTSAYDLGDTSPMDGIVTGAWTAYPHQVKVWYATREQLGLKTLRHIIAQLKPDYIYLNGIYSWYFSLLPIVLKRLGGVTGTLLLAPRGMLKASALAYKPFKKKVFITLFRMLGFHRVARFQATDKQEQQDILKFFPNAAVWLIPNLPSPVLSSPKFLHKERGHVAVFFGGRIHPIKNLNLLLRALREVKGKVDLTIAGVLEQKDYWKSCEALIRALDDQKTIRYIGEQPHPAMVSKLAQHHLFALPTQGENFGHAIFEALAVGRPVLISDQTPWRKLSDEHAGWDLPLDQPQAFTQALQEAVNWNQEQFDHHCQGALTVATTFITHSSARDAYLNFFS